MSETLLIDPAAKRRALRDEISRKVMKDLFTRWKPRSFGPAYAVRVPEKDGTMNGTRMLMAGVDKVEVCEKMGMRAEIIELTQDEFEEFSLAARMIDNLRLTECELIQGAIYASDQARKYTRELQAVSGGDKKSAAAKNAKTALANQESLPAQWAKSDSDAKNADSGGDSKPLTANWIAHQYFPQVPPRTIDRAKEIRRKHPEVFKRFTAGEFKTFADLRGAVSEHVHKQRREIEQREIERTRRIAISGVTLLHGDNAKEIAKWNHQSPRLIFADPPFNNGWKYDSDPTGDRMPESLYIEGLKKTFRACREILASDGTICICTPARHAGPIDSMMRRELGFDWRTTIYWWNHFPNNMPTAYPEAVKQILVYAKTNKAKHIFHPRYVESRRNALGDARGTTLGKVPDNVWPIFMLPGNAAARSGFTDAPPEQPFEVPLRCVLAHTEPGDLVLDPFCGNGTTGRAAIVAGRKFCGIDRSKRYLDLARVAIEDAAINGPPEVSKERLTAILQDKLPTPDMFEREMMQWQRQHGAKGDSAK